jgi:hypothetical protein
MANNADDPQKPTIDERIEALTHSLELLAQMHRDAEQHNEINWTEIKRTAAENERRFSQIATNFEIVHDSIKRLENIAVAHEQRIDDMESGQQ